MTDAPDISFRDVLSAMNPLQYVPVVGSIYRAVTGDVPVEPLRTMGSLIVSGLTGGPVGLAINAGWRIACPVSTPWHALGSHGAAIIATVILGALIGHYLGNRSNARR